MTGGDDGRINWYDFGDFRKDPSKMKRFLKIKAKNRLKGHVDKIRDLSIFENKSKVIVASASNDKTVKFWDLFAGN